MFHPRKRQHSAIVFFLAGTSVSEVQAIADTAAYDYENKLVEPPSITGLDEGQLILTVTFMYWGDALRFANMLTAASSEIIDQLIFRSDYRHSRVLV